MASGYSVRGLTRNVCHASQRVLRKLNPRSKLFLKRRKESLELSIAPEFLALFFWLFMEMPRLFGGACDAVMGSDRWVWLLKSQVAPRGCSLVEPRWHEEQGGHQWQEDGPVAAATPEMKAKVGGRMRYSLLLLFLKSLLLATASTWHF